MTQAQPLNFLHAGPDTGPLLLLAHGAGAAMDSPFMTTFVGLLADRSLATARFEFAYMAARRDGGKRRPPPKAETLIPEYAAALEAARARWPGRAVAVGGKSMGGRVASLMAGQGIAVGALTALVCLGYPFHPPNKPGQLRTSHLSDIACPILIVQGERDPFGSKAEIASLGLPPSIDFHWASDGDHDLGPRGNSGFTRKGNLAAAADAVAEFVLSHSRGGVSAP